MGHTSQPPGSPCRNASAYGQPPPIREGVSCIVGPMGRPTWKLPTVGDPHSTPSAQRGVRSLRMPAHGFVDDPPPEGGQLGGTNAAPCSSAAHGQGARLAPLRVPGSGPAPWLPQCAPPPPTSQAVQAARRRGVLVARPVVTLATDSLGRPQPWPPRSRETSPPTGSGGRARAGSPVLALSSHDLARERVRAIGVGPASRALEPLPPLPLPATVLPSAMPMAKQPPPAESLHPFSPRISAAATSAGDGKRAGDRQAKGATVRKGSTKAKGKAKGAKSPGRREKDAPAPAPSEARPELLLAERARQRVRERRERRALSDVPP